MARGGKAQIGDRLVARNGYHYIKTEDGWRLTHHTIAEQALGRPIDTKVEIVAFVDRDRNNLHPDNIEVRPKKTPSRERRIAELKAKIADCQAELEGLEN